MVVMAAVGSCRGGARRFQEAPITLAYSNGWVYMEPTGWIFLSGQSRMLRRAQEAVEPLGCNF